MTNLKRIRVCSDGVTVTFQVGETNVHTINIRCTTPLQAYELSHILRSPKTIVTVEALHPPQGDLW